MVQSLIGPSVIVDKVLKRDMTALFGVRRILDLEQVFLYLCLHDGGLLDVKALCCALEAKRPTVESYINLLEATHLIHRLRAFGYGKEVLRGRSKIYLADAALAPSVLLKGKSLLEEADGLARAVETAFSSMSSPVTTAMQSAFPTGAAPRTGRLTSSPSSKAARSPSK